MGVTRFTFFVIVWRDFDLLDPLHSFLFAAFDFALLFSAITRQEINNGASVTVTIVTHLLTVMERTIQHFLTDTPA